MITRRALLASAGAVCVAGIARPALAENGPVVLVPLGGIPALEVSIVQRALSVFYAVQLVAEAPRALPKAAYYPARGRYRAERLLSALETSAQASQFRVLGLANVDISTTKGSIADWGILGLATLDGRVGVLSSFRCRRAAKNPEHIAHRLGKTAVHELGHTFGLEHCPNAGCLMEDGQGSVLTTDREFDLCESCRSKLGARGLLASPRALPPWPKP